MARAGLRAPLVAALSEIKRSDVASVEKGLRWKVDGKSRGLRLHVGRIEGPRHPEPLFLVSFELVPDRAIRPPRPSSPKGSQRQYVAQMEDDLRHVRRELEVAVAELQAVNEELASSNEEVQSANEELQSNNEELQTSKEETQSLNEELQTVNAELTEKLRGLGQANDDLENLVSNIEIATIFLDERLRVKRFTPQAKNVARLIDSDVGRPLADLAMPIGYPDLLTDAAGVLATLHPLEKQASAPGGIWYAVRIRPYRTARNAVDGLVLTFIDITEAKRTERIQAAQALSESIVDALREPLLVLSTALRIVRANRSFFDAFRVDRALVEGKPLESMGKQWSEAKLRDLLEATLRDGVSFERFELVAEFAGVGRRRVLLSGRPVTLENGGKPVLALLGLQDAGEAPASMPAAGEPA
jgi:two-component system CheB/CheR fusion protein